MFAVTGTITLNPTPGTLLLTDTSGTTTIDGTGHTVTISSDNAVGVFQLGANALAALNALVVADGNAGNGGVVNALSGGALTVSNATFSSNNAANGGGLFANASAGLTVVNSTFSGNGAASVGGGIFNTAGLLTLNNSIVADTTVGGDLSAFGTQSGSNNVIEDGTGVGTFFTNSLSGDPGLLALADNGGPTRTHALAPGSIALDAGDASLLPVGTGFDQRGTPAVRVGGAALDVGAFEVQPPAPPPVPPPPPRAPAPVADPAPTPAPAPAAVPNALDGAGTIRILNTDGTTRATVTAYTGFTGRVVAASGDVNRDGVAAVVTGADGHLKVFDGATDTEARSFFAFDAYRGGVQVAAGDLTRDGIADIVVSADADGHVKVFDGATGALVHSFFAFEGHQGAVAVAVGDTDGDGRNELIVAGTATGVHVKAFDAGLAVRGSFVVAGSPGARFALAGDLNGDARADVVVAQGTRVTVIDGPTAATRARFAAFEDTFLGVMAVRVDGDDILAAAEVDGRTHGKKFDGQTFDLLDSYFPDGR